MLTTRRPNRFLSHVMIRMHKTMVPRFLRQTEKKSVKYDQILIKKSGVRHTANRGLVSHPQFMAYTIQYLLTISFLLRKRMVVVR